MKIFEVSQMTMTGVEKAEATSMGTMFIGAAGIVACLLFKAVVGVRDEDEEDDEESEELEEA